MAGIFGNHPVDRWLENELFRYLDQCDQVYCEACNFEGHIDNVEIEETEEKDFWICPKCKKKHEL